MRYDPTGQPHPDMGDEVTAEGLQHIDNCPECRPWPVADLRPHIAAADEAVKALMYHRANSDAELAEIEASAKDLYMFDPAFRYRVQLGVKVIERRHPEIEYLEALRTVLTILALGRQ